MANNEEFDFDINVNLHDSFEAIDKLAGKTDDLGESAQKAGKHLEDQTNILNEQEKVSKKAKKTSDLFSKSLLDVGSAISKGSKKFRNHIEEIDRLAQAYKEAKNAQFLGVGGADAKSASILRAAGDKNVLGYDKTARETLIGDLRAQEKERQRISRESEENIRKQAIDIQKAKIAASQKIRQGELRELRQSIQERYRMHAQGEKEVNASIIKSTVEREKIQQQSRQRELTDLRLAIQERHKLQQRELADQEKLIQSGYRRLANTRYAAYDVASTLTIISAANLALAVSIGKVGADYESLFTSVERTSGATGAGLDELRTSLEDMTKVMPLAFDEVTKVATLAGQLGIATEAIDEFSEVVLQFSAVTAIQVDTVAESFGRIAQLAKVPTSEYENLGAAIYQVGVTSVSTEQQIISIAEQISVSANSAGFAADQTIALASALASLGVAPERARGSIQRIFAIIDQSVAKGGETLEKFAEISNTSASQFSETWRTDAQGAFVDFLNGLNDVEKAGGNISLTLQEVGIGAIRDADALTRLANNMSVYTDAITEATTAYAEGTALVDGYALINDDLNSILKELGNTVKLITKNFANNAVLKFFARGLQRVLDVIERITSTPVGAVIGAIIGTITVLIGVLGAVVAAALLFYGGLAGLVTVLDNVTKEGTETVGVVQLLNIALQRASGSAKTAELNMRSFGTTMRLSGTVLGNFGNGLKAAKGQLDAVAGASRGAAIAVRTLSVTLTSIGIGIAIGLISTALDGLINKSETFSDLGGLSGALRKDAKIYQETGEFLGKLTTLYDEQGNVLVERVNPAIKDEAYRRAIATGNIRENTVVLGENTKAWLFNQTIQSEGFKKFANQLPLVKGALEAQGIDIETYLKKILSGESIDLTPLINKTREEARRLRDELQAEAETGLNNISKAIDPEDAAKLQELNDALVGLEELQRISDDFTEAAVGATNFTEASGLLADALGIVDDLGGDVGDTVDRLSSDMFDAASAAAELNGQMFSLGQTIGQNGATLDLATEAGRANYDAISQTLELMYAQAGGDQNIFDASANSLMVFLQGLGFGIQDLQIFRSLISNEAITLTDPRQIEQLGNSLNRGFASGMNNARKATEGANKALSQTKKEIRTISDYADDLKKVFSEAFNFRFGFQNAQDATTKVIQNIADGFEQARIKARDLKNEILELSATLNSLSSQRNVLQYQLSVAREFGDGLREQVILSELEKNAVDYKKAQDDLADKTRELSEATEASSGTLTGNSEAAIDNRKNIQDLLKAYQDQIVEYANTGASQEQVRQYAAKLRGEFESQAEQLGFNREEVRKYTKSFDDVRSIIAKIPRNITTGFDIKTDPAARALKEFWDRKDVKNNTRNRSADFTINSRFNDSAIKKLKDFAYYQKQANAYGHEYNKNASNRAYENWQYYLGKLSSFSLYRSGGYTGGGNPDEVAGLVHKGEYVLNEKATSEIPRWLLDAMNTRGASGLAGAMTNNYTMPGSMMVELSPYDRQLLERAGNISLSIDGRILTSTVNRGNVGFNRVGAGG